MEKLIDAMNNTGFEMKEGTVAKPRLVLFRIRPVDGDRLFTNSPVYINEALTLAKCDLVTLTAKPDDYLNDVMQQMVIWCIKHDWKMEYLTTQWWKVEIATEPGAMFDCNSMLYQTYDLAHQAMVDLVSRWSAVRHAQVSPASRIEVAGALAKTVDGPNPNMVREPKGQTK